MIELQKARVVVCRNEGLVYIQEKENAGRAVVEATLEMVEIQYKQGLVCSYYFLIGILRHMQVFS